VSTSLFPSSRWLVFALAFAVAAVSTAQSQSPAQPQPSGKQFSNEQLDQLTAQIALYPDPLLAQVLMASTYPADVAEAAKWSRAHSEEKGDAAVEKVQDQPWDPSVQSLVAFPQVIIMMGEKPDWVKDLGDAFLAQSDDVMNSVQRLRAAAQKAGNLNSNDQVSVKTEAPAEPTASSPPQVIVIEQKNPEVIYVPQYNPTVVYGTWPYPAYPPYYVPYPPGYWFSGAVATGIAWGVGIAAGAALWGGCNWGRGDVNVNVNRYNNINRNNQINRGNLNNATWSHNTANRRDTAYRGGDAQRQNLQRNDQAANREQFRGKDADRARAQQSLQSRGVDTNRGSLNDANRGNLQQQARNQGYDRSQANRGGGDFGGGNRSNSINQASPMQQRSGGGRNEAFQGVSDRNAGSAANRGNASRQSAQSYNRGGGAAHGGGGASRGGGGGGRGGGGGGRGGGGRR